MKPEHAPVRTRRVYYLSGFDPRGARFYHRLYANEARRQAERLGYAVEVGRREARGGHACWQVDATWPDGQSVQADYVFLGWDDIVRQHWVRSSWRLVATAVVSYSRYVRVGAFARLLRSHRGALYSGLFPVVYLALWLAALVGALALGGAAGSVLMPGAVGGLLGTALAGAGALVGGAAVAKRLGVFWLLRTYLFVERWGVKGCPELEARIDHFAEQIVRTQREQPTDDVLLVGHSVGALIAAAVAEKLLRQPADAVAGVTLLTLGQCVPLLAFIPQAAPYRQQVVALAEDGRIPWFDVTAKVDPLCFHAMNPAQVCEAPDDAPGRAVMHNARFFRMFRPDTYRRLRRDKLRLHFQYLMSSELDAGYDYFQLTAGPRPAREVLEPSA